MNGVMRINAQRDRGFGELINFYMWKPGGDFSELVEPLNIKRVNSEEAANLEHRPAFRLLRDEAQELMDQLWYVGIRPTEGTGSTGSLAATQKHLEDMRKIAFNQLKLETTK